MHRLVKSDIFSAPVIEEAIPPSEEKLTLLISDLGPSIDLYFSLGNCYLRAAKLGQAVEAYEAVLKLDRALAEVHVNLAVALIHQNKLELGLSHLRQAELLKPDLALVHLHTARVLSRLGLLEEAFSSFERLLKLESENVEALLFLAGVAEEQGNNEQAGYYYARVLQVDPENLQAKNKLAKSEFVKSKQHFIAGERILAYSVWAKANEQLKPAFSTEQTIVQGMAELISGFKEQGGLKPSLKAYRSALKNNINDHSLVYPIFCDFFFLVGIFPDCFETLENLDKEIARWKKSLELNGEHPFPHYRLGLIYCYQNRLKDADAELRACQDKLLPKKQASLKLKRIIEFLGELLELQQQKIEENALETHSSEWEKYGFGNRFQIKAWRKTGLLPEEASSWKKAGFTPTKTAAWHKRQIELEQALEWTKEGFTSPESAHLWLRGGFEPSVAKLWQEKFTLPIEQAIQCYKAGFSDPILAQVWLEVFMFPWEAMRWIEKGFTPEQAKSWLEQGVNDPFIAAERLNTKKKKKGVAESNGTEPE